MTPVAAAAAAQSTADRVSDAFAAEGALHAAIAGFVPRHSQLAMALKVREVIAEGGTLIAEAGTGTGKTFAYLVPALLEGGKVLISTGTKPLQDQLFRKDLPAVMRALRISAATALLKGRQNYVCLHRLARAEGEALLSSREDVRHLASIARFARSTTSGDRAELGEVPEGATIWPLVTSTRENCLGSECPRFGDCFVFKARRDAQAADIVVVNHHLFLADLALRDDAIREFLPTVDTVILDEAHQLPAVAADFFGNTLSLAQLMELSRDARALGSTKAPDGASWIQLTSAFERSVRDVRLTLGELGLEAGARAPLDRIRDRVRLLEALKRVVSETAQLQRAFEINRGRDAELDLLAPRTDDLARALGRWIDALGEESTHLHELDDPDHEPSVRWIQVSNHGAQLNETPLAPGRALARARSQQPQAWILTSATLTTGGRFDHAIDEIGIQDMTTARWESPFDFPRQALLYLPQSMPSPGDSDFAEQVADRAWPLIRSNGGRAFVLCTTLRAVDRVAARLRALLASEQLELPLLVQGTSTRRALIESFRHAGNAVLIGSMSFWEGIDIRGDTLSLVVVDKLPFAPPDDPIVAAKVRHLRRRGRNPFNEYQLPEAVVLLKQGVGRLIRDEHDRGVLMILDDRLLSKSYGRTVLESLPPFARTRSETEAIAFLAAGRKRE